MTAGTGYRTAIATVCLAGTLENKLPAAAAAGFSGVEMFDPDLVATPWSPVELRRRCADLGLGIDLYQPLRDVEGVRPERFRANLRRAERKFDVMEQLGTDTLLVCSAVDGELVDDDDLAAEQLHALAVRAGERGLRIAYEALAWGRFVNTWQHSWDIVRAADHPALGLCLDSFHILSRSGDVAPIRELPGERIFFLQLADAPPLDMGVLHWSRHHRLFPGQGAFDLPAFLGAVLAAGYGGPLSLEVFNDVYRQSDPRRTAVDALRSLLSLQDRLAGTPDDRLPAPERSRLLRPPAAPELSGFAFGEIGVDGVCGERLAATVSSLGFVHTGQHRSKPVQLWEQGEARIVLNWGHRPAPEAGAAGRDGPGTAAISAFGVTSADVEASVGRAGALLAPVLPRSRGPADAELAAVAAPDGTSVFFCRPDDPVWSGDFLSTGGAVHDPMLTGIDHIALTQPFDAFDESLLFYRSVLGLEPHTLVEVASPVGLQRNRAVKNAAGTVRIPLSAGVLRGAAENAPGAAQHIAFGCTDIFAAAALLKNHGAPLLSVPDNYYADLDARLAPDPALLDALRRDNVLYDRDADGELFQLYTEVIGSGIFFEVLQRTGRYDGYGAVNTPVHMGAHYRARLLRRPVPDR